MAINGTKNGKWVNSICISCIKMLIPPYAHWCIFAYQPCWKRVLEHTFTNWIVIGCRAQSTFIYIELYTLYTLISNQIVILKFSTIVNIREISFFIKKFFFPRIKSSNLTDWFESNMKILDSKEQNFHFVTNKKLIVITSGSYCDL